MPLASIQMSISRLITIAMDTTFTMGAMDIMSILCIQKKVLQQEQLLVSFSCAVSVEFVFSAQNPEIMRNKLKFML
jgi:hypothetical protein